MNTTVTEGVQVKASSLRRNVQNYNFEVIYDLFQKDEAIYSPFRRTNSNQYLEPRVISPRNLEPIQSRGTSRGIELKITSLPPPSHAWDSTHSTPRSAHFHDDSPTRDVEVQTIFRDSEAQTLPYSPDYRIPFGNPNPEILQLAELGLGSGIREILINVSFKLQNLFRLDETPWTWFIT
jgi:hypothetical protein